MWMRLALLLLGLLCLLPFQGDTQAVRSVPGMEALPNDTSTGTTQNLLLKWVSGTGGAAKAILAATTDTTIPLFPCINGCGLSGEANFRTIGFANCVFDNTSSSAARTFVVVSPTTAGRCHQQTGAPATGNVVGYLAQDTTTVGQPALIYVQNTNYTPGSGAGTGTVTSVGLTMPAEFTVSGSPVSTSGTIQVLEASQAQNTVYAGPTSGSGAPNFRALVAADVPAAPPGGAAGGDLAGTYPNPSVAKAATTFALVGETTPSALTGTANDYGNCVNAVCNINGGALDRDITGIAAPAQAGTIYDVCNVGTTNSLTLKQQNAGSSQNNRFELSGDITLAPGVCEALRYHSSLRWRAVTGTVPDYLKLRMFGLILGDPGTNSPPLAADNDSPSAITNDYERPVTIKTIACWADAGGLVLRIILTGGTQTSVITVDGNCTCGTQGWGVCNVQQPPSAPVINSFSGTGATCTAPCSLDVLIQSTTGAAKYASIKMKGMIQ